MSVMVSLRPCTLTMYATAKTMVDEAGVRKVLRGDVGTFQGLLKDEATNTYLVDKTVILEKDGVEIGRATSPTSGYTIITYDFPTEAEATSHEYILHFPGDEVYAEIFSSVMKVMVEARAPAITFTIYPTDTPVNATLTWYGELSDPKISTLMIPGATVYLQRDEVDTTDTAVTRENTSYPGRYYGTTTAPALPGTYLYRSRYPGGAVNFGIYDSAISIFEEIAIPLNIYAFLISLLVGGVMFTLCTKDKP